ncbi:hypothetical protein [Streptomyces monashensis]|uniref:DUF5709 domain-containing protein n=1 Tax=Streptomyces monashensis TaxID=1678012 RepID=A0A1S2PWM4_9ACTN|nr:hypothetical protein [Streptomyces monashensis]OIJ98219.1 hypothetical protein BIV23_30155 [Streptomyces monashensis]
MAYDPTEPDTTDDPESETAELDVEAPEGDAAEQHADLAPDSDDPLTDVDPDRAANVADQLEQAHVVRLDEDDYR